MTTKERIEKDAGKIANHLCAPNEIEKYHDIYTGAVAGATSERNKTIDEALSEVWKLYDTTLHTGLHKVANILESLKL